MRAGLLILLSFAVAVAPAAAALACAAAPATVASAPGARVEHDEQSCCCAPGTIACVCDSCADDAPQSGDKPSNGLGAKQSCLCGQTTPQNNETSRTVSVGTEVRLAIGVVAARHKGRQQRGIAQSAAAPRRDPHPEVRQPLLL